MFLSASHRCFRDRGLIPRQVHLSFLPLSSGINIDIVYKTVLWSKMSSNEWNIIGIIIVGGKKHAQLISWKFE